MLILETINFFLESIFHRKEKSHIIKQISKSFLKFCKILSRIEFNLLIEKKKKLFLCK